MTLTTIITDDGFKKVMKRATVNILGKTNGTWRFMLRELTKEERKEASRKKRYTTA
ncbi:MAG: hypothetical protein IJ683_07770 [Butyrivibrio sp.]|nr:hypothetical protein [Butyrivibrio sp.]MBR1642203.1 hypothetical protein [Butyrivibrio sp.]